MQNIRHRRKVLHPFWRWVDWCSFRFASLFQLGPWHCVYCGSVQLFLRSPQKGVRDFEKDRKGYQQEQENQSVGNFITGEGSLTSAIDQADRFSEKFRQGVVRRVLSGNVSRAQICRELKISSSDLTRWIEKEIGGGNVSENRMLTDAVTEAEQPASSTSFRVDDGPRHRSNREPGIILDASVVKKDSTPSPEGG